ncbi:D-glycero-alpha-D-manno-heptose-1,7-bisphosphate 7-phosphatase [Streptomyces sp. P1-3]|uniref:D-glycero-alpha-D-manno-heptose-1,7-bisphosphate 7-phosphatase n=1 Tax=Streptomyces sp. P1-3 TaxID=3421658 RepID=UPI003D35FA6F
MDLTGTLTPLAGDRAGHTQRAVFLDRDGTLTEPRHYPRHPEDLVLQPGIGPPLRALQDQGLALVVVTNQSGLARGLFDEPALTAMHHRLRDLLAGLGVHLTGIYACPHHPEGNVRHLRTTCHCRKPQPGMLQQAAADLHLDLTGSWMIGDSTCDIQAGRRAGTRTALAAPNPLPGCLPDVWGTTTASALTHVHNALRAQGTGEPRPSTPKP